MTKYYQDKHKFNKDTGVPVSLPNYEQIELDSRIEHYCPYCQLKLSRLTDRSGLNPSYYCPKCVIEYLDSSETKSKSHVSTARKSNNNQNPLATTKFVEPSVDKPPVQIKGGLAELAKRGIKVTSYKEGKG